MENENFNINCNIHKVDEEQKIIFAWASVIEKNGEPIVDRQGDVISEPDLENAVYDYVINSRRGGEMHVRKDAGTLVESIVFTKEKQNLLGIDLGMVGWFVGIKINDDNVWKRVKDGTYSMLSIGGKGMRSKIEE